MRKPPYIASSGNFYTVGLFYEPWSLKTERDQHGEGPVFTLRKDIPGLINAHKTFVELQDPTGYKWAMRYLASWKHFQKLIETTWFREAYDEWIEEINTKQKAEAIQRIRDIAADVDDKQSLQANRYIAEQGWEKPVRGRPSKLELTGKLKNEVERLTVEDEDMKRIGLTVIEGGKK